MGGIFETSSLDEDLKNNYNNIEVLDYNGYEVTHKCKENNSGKILAVKIINKKYLERICGTKNVIYCLNMIRKGIEYMKKNGRRLFPSSYTNNGKFKIYLYIIKNYYNK